MHKPKTDTDYLSKLGYESRDVALPTLVKSVIWLFVFMIGSAVVTLVIYMVLLPGEVGVPQPMTRAGKSGVPAAQPLVQNDVTATKDIRDMIARDEDILNHPGPAVDDPKARRIPVEQAMALTLQEGLPVRGQTGSDPSRETNLEDVPATAPSAELPNSVSPVPSPE